MEPEGKVALVTGGAARLGRALSLALAGRGVRLAVHYGKSAGPAEETVAAIRGKGGVAEPFQADLRDISQVNGLVDRVARRLGHVDILINNASIFRRGDIADTTEADWDEHFATNLKAPFFLSRAFALHVGKERPGLIVNMADWRGIRPGPHYLAYTLTKSGLIAMTQSLALALAPNIRVNAIAPGAILPPPGGDDAYLEQLAQHIPLRRKGSPGEVVSALEFLVASDFITGQTVFVDGGEHL
jgi:NAD(P)-dependent dehydrogenase (short-subunit alcohol dehydrogenase family)